jgi:hypothetical protein
MSVDRNTFMPKNGLQLDAQARRTARVNQRRIHGDPRTERPQQRNVRLDAAASTTNTPFFVPMVRMTRSATLNLLRRPEG